MGMSSTSTGTWTSKDALGLRPAARASRTRWFGNLTKHLSRMPMGKQGVYVLGEHVDMVS